MKSKALGSMFGLAIGDALGAPVEFKDRGTFKRVATFMGGGKFNVITGEYTDDMAMALCLAQSLIDCKGVNQKDQLQKYLNWYENGYMSANNRSIGCGKNILLSLGNFKLTNCNECGSKKMKKRAGNGSLMRVAPNAIYYRDNLQMAIEASEKSSYTTHGLKICADACALYTGLIFGALNGATKEELLSNDYINYLKKFITPNIDKEILDVAYGSYKEKSEDEISSSGYVVNTLEASLWAFYNSNSFDEGVLMAVNLGADADTVGAVYGQLAGAYYSIENINKEWVKNICQKELIKEVTLNLLESN